MGANPAQAIASLLFMLAFVSIAYACYQGFGLIAILIGIAMLAASIVLFRKARPWEYQDKGNQS